MPGPPTTPIRDRPDRHNGGLSKCGAVACAVGHGPAAGVLFQADEIKRQQYGDQLFYPDWPRYAQRFVTDATDFEWAFSGEWASGGEWGNPDSHHWGAAARIRYLLKHGKAPEEFDGCPTRKWREAYREFDKRHAVKVSAHD